MLLNETSRGSRRPRDTHLRLVSTNKQAAEINSRELSRIDSKIKTIEACDTVITTEKTSKLLREVRNRLEHAAPRSIVSKVGVRVTLTCKFKEHYPGSELKVLQMRPYSLKNGETYSLVCQPYSNIHNGVDRIEGNDLEDPANFRI